MDAQHTEENNLNIEEVILQYWPQINFRVRKSLGFNNTEWEDVASEIIFDVIKAIKTRKFRGDSKIGTFIYVITSRRIIDYIRKKSRNIKYINDALQHNHFVDPCEIVQKKEQIELLSVSLKKLKPRDADILYLYFYMGLTQKEIAQMYGISARKVYEIMKNAKLSLKKIIQRGGNTTTKPNMHCANLGVNP